jgi:hypothetical protein
MSKLFARCRNFAAVSALAVGVTACGGGGTGPVLLTSAEVGGVYHVCELRFQPNQTLLPPVNVRGVAIDTTAQATTPARLRLDTQTNGFELEYSAPGSTLPRRLGGTYQPGAASVTLSFTTPADALSALLLPTGTEMEFQAGPQRLHFSRANADVPRQSYVQMANISPEGIADPVRGTISGRFAVGGCAG